MALGQPTVRKFVREAFVTATPMIPDENDLETLKQRLRATLVNSEDVRFRWNPRKGYDDEVELGTLSIRHPRYDFHGTGFSLILDAQKALHLRWNHCERAPVGSVEELLDFLRLVLARVTRTRGLQSRQDKVRKLRTAAIVAWVQKLARTLSFDYATQESATRLLLHVRFAGQDVIEFSIPFAKFQALMPPIESALPVLRDLGHAGVAAYLRPRMGKQAPRGRRNRWILHQTLANAGPDTVSSADE